MPAASTPGNGGGPASSGSRPALVTTVPRLPADASAGVPSPRQVTRNGDPPASPRHDRAHELANEIVERPRYQRAIHGERFGDVVRSGVGQAAHELGLKPQELA
jgi:hypothetical protein